jgi:HEAT repeat protein
MNQSRWCPIVGLSVLAVLLAAPGMPAGALAAEPSALETQLLKGDAPARIAAAKKLALSKDPATAASLAAALKDAEPLVKRFAIYALERIGDASAVAKIAPLTADGDVWVRRAAVVALGKLGAKDCVPELLKALSDANMHVRCDAFNALGRIGDPATQKPLLEAMKEPRLWHDLDVWEQTEVFGVTGLPFWTDTDAVPLLKQMLDYDKQPHPELDKLDQISRDGTTLIIANSAAQVLARKFKDSSGEDWLIKALWCDLDFNQQDSAVALGMLKSKKAVPALVKALEGNPSNEKWFNSIRLVINALGEIGDPAAVAPLEKFLTHADFRMRSTAAAALAKIDGKKREVAPDGPPAVPPTDGNGPATPGNKRPPQFICLGVDDCANVEGVESMLDICETLKAKGSRAVFTMWLAPLAGAYENRDMEKMKLIYQGLFDLGCEIAHHTLHHNPDGQNWASLPLPKQVEEIDGCTQWYRDNIQGFTRPFSQKGPGGGHAAPPDPNWPADPNFTRWLMAKQNFIYSGFGRGDQHPNAQGWPTFTNGRWNIPTGRLDAGAPPVHATITDPIRSDYPGRFDYDMPEGLAMWKANFDYHYHLPQRPIIGVNAFHDWGLADVKNPAARGSRRNEGKLVKEFLLDVLVKNKDKYPEAYCVSYSQLLEYCKSADLKHALAAGNCQDSRNPEKPTIDSPQP